MWAFWSCSSIKSFSQRLHRLAEADLPEGDWERETGSCWICVARVIYRFAYLCQMMKWCLALTFAQHASVAVRGLHFQLLSRSQHLSFDLVWPWFLDDRWSCSWLTTQRLHVDHWGARSQWQSCSFLWAIWRRERWPGRSGSWVAKSSLFTHHNIYLYIYIFNHIIYSYIIIYNHHVVFRKLIHSCFRKAPLPLSSQYFGAVLEADGHGSNPARGVQSSRQSVLKCPNHIQAPHAYNFFQVTYEP